MNAFRSIRAKLLAISLACVVVALAAATAANSYFVNDTLGHTLGDALLVKVASRLQKHLRSEDLVARLGEDEFVVVVEALPDNQVAAQIADELIAEMEQPFDLEGQNITVTFWNPISAKRCH